MDEEGSKVLRAGIYTRFVSILCCSCLLSICGKRIASICVKAFSMCVKAPFNACIEVENHRMKDIRERIFERTLFATQHENCYYSVKGSLSDSLNHTSINHCIDCQLEMTACRSASVVE